MFGGIATLVIVALLLPGAASSPVGLAPPVPAYTPHTPIQIIGDSGFTPANGVIGGAGSLSDPYVLAGWDIDASQATGQYSDVGILIKDTRANFVIRDVYVHSGYCCTYPFGGITLLNVANGLIERANTTHNYYGIVSRDSRDISIVDLRPYDSYQQAVWIWGSANVSLRDGSWPWDYHGGLFVEDSSGVTVDNTTFGLGSPLSISRSSNVTVSGNRLAEGSLAVADSADVVLVGNSLGKEGGLYTSTVSLLNTSRVSIERNAVVSDGVCAICISSSTFVRLWRNQLTGAGVQLWGDRLEEYASHSVAEDNLVNDKPILFVKDRSSVSLDGGDYGQAIVVNSSLVIVRRLRFEGVSLAIQMAYVEGAVVFLNQIIDSVHHPMNLGSGMIFHQSRAIAVLANTVRTVNSAVYFDRSEDILVRSNNLTAAQATGLVLWESRNATLTLNNVTDSWRPVYLWDSQDVTIFRNGFVRFEIGPYNYASTNISWDDGYPGGGNYWSAYHGTDRCGGPDQDVCTGPDGFGDTPYVINATMQDRYPLMNPPVPSVGVQSSEPSNVPAALAVAAVVMAGLIVLAVLLRRGDVDRRARALPERRTMEKLDGGEPHEPPPPGSSPPK